MSTFCNFMTILFGITMIKTLRRVQTCLVIGSIIREIDVNSFRNVIRLLHSKTSARALSVNIMETGVGHLNVSQPTAMM